MADRVYTWYTDLRLLSDGEETQRWIDLARVGSYKHPIYGELDFTPEKLKQFADNFANNVRGIELDIDYDHKQDPAKGKKAAGWLKQVLFDGNVLKGLVDWTPVALKEIKNKEYRYFSPEFHDKWTDSAGVTHDNVLFGGGITNRPYLKNLLPINLSELVFGEPEPKKENEVDPKALREQLGLPEGATDADVEARLGLIKQFAEAFPSGPPKIEPPAPPTPPAPAPVPSFDFGADIKQLAEVNPAVKALVSFVQSTVEQNKANAKQLVEQNVAMRLNEFDTTNLVLTPVAREMVTAVMLHETMTDPVREMIWSLLKEARAGNKFFVELGERGSAATHRPLVGATAGLKFEGMVKQLMESDKMSYPDAASQISKDYPQLFDEYRTEATAFVE